MGRTCGVTTLVGIVVVSQKAAADPLGKEEKSEKMTHTEQRIKDLRMQE